MSTSIVNEAGKELVSAPAAPAPVHPPIPLGLGSYVSLSGISGATAAFVIAWYDTTPHWHMNPSVAALGVAAVAGVIGFFGSRSHQAAAAIGKVGAVLKEVGVDVTPPPPA